MAPFYDKTEIALYALECSEFHGHCSLAKTGKNVICTKMMQVWGSICFLWNTGFFDI